MCVIDHVHHSVFFFFGVFSALSVQICCPCFEAVCLFLSVSVCSEGLKARVCSHTRPVQ